jgi:hypothetical protein
MSEEEVGAPIPDAEIATYHSSYALASLVRRHLSARPDWPMFEKFVEIILFPFESRSERMVLKDTQDIHKVVSYQDEMMASLTQALVETRTHSKALASCTIEALSKSDANEILLTQFRAGNQSLQVEVRRTSFLFKVSQPNRFLGTTDGSGTETAARN